MTSRGWAKYTPPTYNKGDVVEAEILQVSKVSGTWGPQFMFELQLPSGFRTFCWIPSKTTNYQTRSFGNMIMTFFNEDHSSIEETLERVRDYGLVFVECVGFKAKDGLEFPKFKLVTSKLPVKKNQKRFDNY